MRIYPYKDRQSGKVVSNKHHVVCWVEGRKKGFVFSGTKTEAKVWGLKKELELRADRPPRPGAASRTALSFSDFCSEVYAAHAEKYLAKGTRRNRAYQIVMLVDLVGDTRLDRFTADVVRWVQDQRLAVAGVGPGKVNDDVKVLITILNTAAALGYPVTVPLRARRPGMPGWRPLTVTASSKALAYEADQVGLLYAALGKLHPQLLGHTCTMLNTGMRKGETLVLEWDWVNVARRLIFIQPNEFWRPKDNEPREVPITDALLPWLTRPRQHSRWVFPTLPTPGRPEGDRYQAWPQRQWDEARKLSGIPGSPHMCRHTYASHFLAEKDDIGLLAQIMGHSRTRTTELYTHFRPSHLAQAHNVVNLPVPKKFAPKAVKPAPKRTKASARRRTVSRRRSGDGLAKPTR